MALRTIILGGICIGCLAASILVARFQINTSPVPSNFVFAQMKLQAGSKAEAVLFNTAETYARPLFSWDRRPHQILEKIEPAAEMAPPQMIDEPIVGIQVEPPRLKLLGTESLAQSPSALIELEETGTSSWFRKGELLSGWRIAEISAQTVKLSRDGNEHISFNISLYPEN